MRRRIEAAQAFERYDLVSAAVVNAEDKLMGRVTVNAVMDFIREESESEALNLGWSARRKRICSRRYGKA